MIEVRDGLHDGALQWALVNRIPRFASASKFGVSTSNGAPSNWVGPQSLKSSMDTKRMFGFDKLTTGGRS